MKFMGSIAFIKIMSVYIQNSDMCVKPDQNIVIHDWIINAK